MQNRVHATNVLPTPAPTVVGIVTDSVLSTAFQLPYLNCLNLRVDIIVATITQVGTITLKLQHRDAGGTWADVAGTNASLAITATGTKTLRQNVEDSSNDLQNMPLRPMCRVVVTSTNSADRLTLSAIYFYKSV